MNHGYVGIRIRFPYTLVKRSPIGEASFVDQAINAWYALTMGRRGGKVTQRVNWVATTIENVGGIVQAAAIAGVRQATLYDWKKRQQVRLLRPALNLAEKDCPLDPIAQLKLLRRLAGLEE
jgi:hypothetical protein